MSQEAQQLPGASPGQKQKAVGMLGLVAIPALETKDSEVMHPQRTTHEDVGSGSSKGCP